MDPGGSAASPPRVKGQTLTTEPALTMVIYALPQCEVTASVFRVHSGENNAVMIMIKSTHRSCVEKRTRRQRSVVFMQVCGRT